jgi:hypothetical protein
MKFKYPLTVLGALLLGLGAFLIGRHSANVKEQTTFPEPNRLVKPAPLVVKPKAEKGIPPANMLYPAIPRKQSKYYITHRGPSHEIHIQLWANSLRGISLTADQIQQLQDVYSAVYIARQNYELSIATVAIISEHESLIEIPSYYEFGEQLKNTAYSMFENILGTDTAGKILNQIGPKMWASNEGWGINPQSILVKYNPESKDYSIIHSRNSAPLDGHSPQSVSTSRLGTGNLDSYTVFYSLFPKPKF